MYRNVFFNFEQLKFTYMVASNSSVSKFNRAGQGPFVDHMAQKLVCHRIQFLFDKLLLPVK